VINRCAFPLWIHAVNNDQVVLQPDNVQLPPGGVQQYPVPAEWPAGRVNAYYAEPDANPEAHDKVEMTVTGGIMNYNITYVDYVALPSEMVAVGPECQPGPSSTRRSAVMSRETAARRLPGRPADRRALPVRQPLLRRSCSPGAALLHALDGEIAKCVAQHPETCGVAAQLGNTTRDVYACSGYFDSQPPDCMPASEDCHFEGNKWCAALNRGMLSDPSRSTPASTINPRRSTPTQSGCTTPAPASTRSPTTIIRPAAARVASRLQGAAPRHHLLPGGMKKMMMMKTS
jgi:hypothetical protein